MKKGKFGIVLCLYPILAFIFAALKMPVLCVLLFLAAACLEGDRWAGRQCLAAFFLSLVPTVVSWIRDAFFFLPEFFPFSLIRGIFGGIDAIVYLAALVFCVLGVMRVMKDQEADLPLFSDLAFLAYGEKRPKPVAPPPPVNPQPWQQPQAPQNWQQPQPPQGWQPPQQSPQAPQSWQQPAQPVEPTYTPPVYTPPTYTAPGAPEPVAEENKTEE